MIDIYWSSSPCHPVKMETAFSTYLQKIVGSRSLQARCWKKQIFWAHFSVGAQAWQARAAAYEHRSGESRRQGHLRQALVPEPRPERRVRKFTSSVCTRRVSFSLLILTEITHVFTGPKCRLFYFPVLWTPKHCFNDYHGSGSLQFSSVAQSCLTLCDPMNHNTLGLPVHHQLLKFTQTDVHRVGDAIQPSHPLSSPSPPAPNPSQHQGLF